jgi:hypothetical protein
MLLFGDGMVFVGLGEGNSLTTAESRDLPPACLVFGKEVSLVDCILISPALARHWLKEESYVLTIPN